MPKRKVRARRSSGKRKTGRSARAADASRARRLAESIIGLFRTTRAVISRSGARRRFRNGVRTPAHPSLSFATEGRSLLGDLPIAAAVARGDGGGTFSFS